MLLPLGGDLYRELPAVVLEQDVAGCWLGPLAEHGRDDSYHCQRRHPYEPGRYDGPTGHSSALRLPVLIFGRRTAREGRWGWRQPFAFELQPTIRRALLLG